MGEEVTLTFRFEVEIDVQPEQQRIVLLSGLHPPQC